MKPSKSARPSKPPPKKQKMSLGRKIGILFGLAILIAGLICFLYPNIREWMLNREVDQIIAEFEENYGLTDEDESESPGSDAESGTESEPGSETGVEAGEEAEASTDRSNGFQSLYREMQEYNENLLVNGQDIHDAWDYTQTPVNLSELGTDSDVIGYIEIPDMGVRLPLFIGASTENLAKGAAVMAGTSMPIGGENTNCVIAGHRGWQGNRYFQMIDRLEEGSLVYIVNPWETMVYKVIGWEIVGSKDSDCLKIRKGRDLVTLLTCHPYMAIGGATQRYVVYCERTGVPESDNTAEETVEDTAEETPGAAVISNATTEDGSTEGSTETIEENSLTELEARLRIILPILLAAIGIILLFPRKSK